MNCKKRLVLIAAAVLLILSAVLGIAEEVPTYPLELKYATFHYTDAFVEALSIVVSEQEDSCIIAASTTVMEEEIPLYTLILTKGNAEGAKVGVLRDRKMGNINVILQMNEPQCEYLSEAGYSRIYELQEGINELISQLEEDPRFDSDF